MGTNLYLAIAELVINGQPVVVQKPVRAPSPEHANAMFQYWLPELLLAQGVTVSESDTVEGGVRIVLEDNPHKTRAM